MIDDRPPGSSEPHKHERKLIAEARGEAEEARRRERALEATATERSPGSGAAPILPPGDSLPGYDILDKIHGGGQGVVYKAFQKSTKRKVAVKVMREGPSPTRASGRASSARCKSWRRCNIPAS